MQSDKERGSRKQSSKEASGRSAGQAEGDQRMDHGAGKQRELRPRHPADPDRAIENEQDFVANERQAISDEREAITNERASIARERDVIQRERAAIDKERQRFDLGWGMIEKGKGIIRQELEQLILERQAWENERDREKQALAKRKADLDGKLRELENKAKELDAREKDSGGPPRGVEQIIEEEIQRAAREEIEKIRGAWMMSLSEAEKARVEIERIKSEWEKERERQVRERDEFEQEKALLERFKASFFPTQQGLLAAAAAAAAAGSPSNRESSPMSRALTEQQALQAVQLQHQLMSIPLARYQFHSHTVPLPQPQPHLQPSQQRQLHPIQHKSESEQTLGKKRHREEEDQDDKQGGKDDGTASRVDDDDDDYDSSSAHKERRTSPMEDFEYSSDSIRSRSRRTWEERYEELKAFKQKHGHLYIPYSGNMKQLYEWVSTQRKNHRKKILKKDRFQLLDALGFPWTGKREFLASTKGSTSSSPPPQHRMGPGSVAALLGPMDEGPQPSSSLLSSLASLANEERNRPKSHSEDDPSSGED